MQSDWYQAEVRLDGQLVDTGLDEEHCSITTPDESDYDCDFYNVYDPGENPPQPVLGCTDSAATNYNPAATSGNSEAAACTYEESGGGGGSSSGGRRTVTPEPLVLGESTTNFCPFITEYMQTGWDNDPWEVMKLQLFLNIFKDVYGGVSNPVTGVFGEITTANVKTFQEHYRSEILDPWFNLGIVPHNRPTGFVYKTTSWKINSLVCPENAAQPNLVGENLTTNVALNQTGVSD